MSAQVVVVGAGISGIACAQRCAAAGLGVEVLDRGHRIGGRLTTRTMRDEPRHHADVGAPYCTVSDPRFRAVMDTWIERGLAHEWTDTFATAGPMGLGEPSSGPMRFASTSGARALVEDLASGLQVHSERSVETIEPGPSVGDLTPKVVVLAMPGPQAARLLHAHFADLEAVADQPYEPTLTLTARWPERTWAEFGGAFVSNVAELRWITDDGHSRGDGEPVLVAHSTPEFAEQYLEDPEAATAPMLKALRGVIGATGDPLEARVHRWRFARPTGSREATFHLSASGVGLCGDGWSAKSRVEAAWLSGDDLGAAIATRLA